jgi:hypothetical protein
MVDADGGWWMADGKHMSMSGSLAVTAVSAHLRAIAVCSFQAVWRESRDARAQDQTILPVRSRFVGPTAACTPRSRLAGGIGSAEVDAGPGMWLADCQSASLPVWHEDGCLHVRNRDSGPRMGRHHRKVI